MNTKKTILVIVEGWTDDKSLGWHIDHALRDESHNVVVTYYRNNPRKYPNKKDRGGEITGTIKCKEGYRKAELEDVQSRIAEIMQDTYETKCLELEDYDQIIQIIDTDGRFIKRSHIKGEPYIKDPIYSESKITVNERNVEKFAKTCEYKKKACLKLVQAGKLEITFHRVSATLPYRVFFMSCNLEHVLHDVQNPENKPALSSKARQEFFSNTEKLLAFLADNNACLGDTYNDSWKQIQKGTTSLERHTNLHLLLKRQM